MIGVCVCLAVMLIVGLSLSPVVTTGAGFVNPNDQHYVFDVGHIWYTTWNEAAATFRRVHFPTGTGGYYQPFTALSLMFDAYLTKDWASRAFDFHVTNLFLHMANVALLFVLLRRLSGSTFWAAICALIFGLHPLQVESVASVAQRMTLLATHYALFALICYMHYGKTRRFRWFVPVPIFYAAAILSKPTFIGLPVVFLILDVWPLRRRTWRPLIEKIPLFVLLVVCGAVHLHLQSMVKPTCPADVGGLELLARNVSSFAARTVWPIQLSPFYPMAESAGGAGLSAVTGLGILVLAAAVLTASFVISRPLFAAIAGAVVLVFPALFNVPFTDGLLGDQYLYAVLLAPIIVWAAWLKRRGDILHESWGRCVAIAMAAVIMVFSVRSYTQAHIWRSSRSLYEHAVAQYPNWPGGYFGLVNAFVQEGDLDAALHYAEKVVTIAPDDPSAKFYLGRVLLLHRDGRSREAVELLRNALASDPNWIDCLHNLGVALMDSGEVVEAIGYLERARDLQPRAPAIRTALGTAYLKVDRPASARGEFQLALKEQNDPMTHLGLAEAWAANDMPEYARRHLSIAVAHDPRYAALAAHYPSLRRLRHEPGFESLIDASDHPPDITGLDGSELPPARTSPGL